MTKYYVGSSLKYHCVFEKVGDKKRKILFMLNCRRNAELIVEILTRDDNGKAQTPYGILDAIDDLKDNIGGILIENKRLRDLWNRRDGDRLCD